MTSSGVTEFYLTGGEPFARDDLVDIIAAIDPNVAEVYVNTNGYFITQEVADALSGTALRRITVSVDGHNREAQALVRHKPTSFDRAIVGVERLLAAGVPVRVNSGDDVHEIVSGERFASGQVELGNPRRGHFPHRVEEPGGAEITRAGDLRGRV
jgi:molybdenum cofactor biosynthesis enzyme MoaA